MKTKHKIIPHALKGFTLIELLLYIAASSILLLSVGGIYEQILFSRVKNQTINEVNQEGIRVMQLMTQSIRNATAISSPSAGQTTSLLSLSATDSARNPTIFDRSVNTLRITEGVSAPIALTSAKTSISLLSFSNLALATTSASIKIQFSLTHSNASGRNAYSYTQQFYGTATIKK